MTELKTCSKCGESKPTQDYHACKSKPDGLASNCKRCRNAAGVIYTASKAEELKAYRETNAEKIKAYQASYQLKNADRLRASKAAYYASNNEKVKASVAAYRAEHKEDAKAYRAAYYLANLDRESAVQAAYYEDNAEKIRSAQASYYANNSDEIKARVNLYRAANPETVSQLKAAYRAANPEKARIHNRNRRARKLNAGGELSPGLSAKLFTLQRGKCACGCEQPLDGSCHMDHRMPLARGGSNTDDNMQLLRAVCNLQKGAKHPVDFMQSRGFLL